MSNITSSVESLTDLNSFLLTESSCLHILAFRTEWDEASKSDGPSDKLISTLASKHPTVRFGRVDAESPGGMEVAEQFSVSAVPFFAFVKNKTVIAFNQNQTKALGLSWMRGYIHPRTIYNIFLYFI